MSRYKYVVSVTRLMLQAMIDIQLNYFGDKSPRYDGRVMRALERRRFVEDYDPLDNNEPLLTDLGTRSLRLFAEMTRSQPHIVGVAQLRHPQAVLMSASVRRGPRYYQ